MIGGLSGRHGPYLWWWFSLLLIILLLFLIGAISIVVKPKTNDPSQREYYKIIGAIFILIDITLLILLLIEQDIL